MTSECCKYRMDRTLKGGMVRGGNGWERELTYPSKKAKKPPTKIVNKKVKTLKLNIDTAAHTGTATRAIVLRSTIVLM